MRAVMPRKISYFKNETKRNSLKLFLFEKTSYICNREPCPSSSKANAVIAEAYREGGYAKSGVAFWHWQSYL